ncbi:MAG: nif-specific transcriptional activator NifA [Candidatus Lambdaproteobacteria bacterium RIFOXYD2_FULL_56_26]|uniref:Nif-specific regulatory protein n=1 Tax=Candidatus Lambdaproteobacteria bacterium RIFOXYD2_FULL_56_26 TaxID=1817773 RepID=A0A1F6H1Y1_9PROT|nr:MAG: nif-specific transcriptional activator NifA [Candidatus Lambdaproteobacteria bacterium RIFOXYC1_FULL_56_13]OGH04375.1 MAG: nif-specific transcriptional activator NifA [Candidatus Lambdaproteobacteria bacterium RIFOXYD2_FULL_56_26]
MSDLNGKALEVIHQVSLCFNEDLDTRTTLLRILGILEQRLGYCNGMVSLFDRETDSLLVEAFLGKPGEKTTPVSYKKGEGIVGLIVATQKPLTIRRLGDDPRFLNRLGLINQDHCFVGVPILDRTQLLGVLSITLPQSEKGRLDEHAKIVTILANLVGGVLSRLARQEVLTQQIQQEAQELKQQIQGRGPMGSMVGGSRAMKRILESVKQVALWDTTVLIRGESGTGKELVAKAIHAHSPRVNQPLVKLNCAALPDNLLESELFGYEKGAFTGAMRRKPGRFEMAHKGTLYLDEIGDTSLAFQTKLLRVLQEGEFERLGGEETLKVDVRIIAATHVNLEEAVAQRRFREDLYYRLSVMPLFLAPLRDRREDIPLLVEHFLKLLAQKSGHALSISTEAMRVLEQCNFPGNVRELENCVHRGAVTAKDGLILPCNIACTSDRCLSHAMHQASAAPGPTGGMVGSGPAVGFGSAPLGSFQPSGFSAPQSPTPAVPQDLQSIANERDRVIAALRQAGFVQAKAARLLNLTPRQIAYRIKTLKIEVESF